MNRRTLIAGLGIGGLASLSGCLGLIGMDEHESTPAGVDGDVRSNTGYELTNVDEIVVEEAVGTDAYSETIVVRNHLTELEKSVDMGVLGEQRGAVFSVLSTPQVGLFGQQFNPVEDMDAAELVELIASNYDGIENVTFEEEEAVTILGQATMRSRFTADAEFDGTSVDVDLHVSEAVETDEDLVVTVGVYPQDLRSQEEDNVVALMEGVTEVLEDEPADDADGSGDGNESDDADESGDGTDENESGDGESDDGDGSDGDGSDGDEQENDGSGDGDDGDGNESDDDGIIGE